VQIVLFGASYYTFPHWFERAAVECDGDFA